MWRNLISFLQQTAKAVPNWIFGNKFWAKTMQTVAEGWPKKERGRESEENTQHNSIYSNKLTVRDDGARKLRVSPSGTQMGMEWSLGSQSVCVCLLGISSRVCVCSICKLRNRLGKYFLWVPETAFWIIAATSEKSGREFYKIYETDSLPKEGGGGSVIKTADRQYILASV